MCHTMSIRLVTTLVMRHLHEAQYTACVVVSGVQASVVRREASLVCVTLGVLKTKTEVHATNVAACSFHVL